MGFWRISKQSAYDLVGKETAEEMKREKGLKWDEIADEIIKMKTKEMATGYIENIFGSVLSNIPIEPESLGNESKQKWLNNFQIRE